MKAGASDIREAGKLSVCFPAIERELREATRARRGRRNRIGPLAGGRTGGWHFRSTRSGKVMARQSAWLRMLGLLLCEEVLKSRWPAMCSRLRERQSLLRPTTHTPIGNTKRWRHLEAEGRRPSWHGS